MTTTPSEWFKAAGLTGDLKIDGVLEPSGRLRASEAPQTVCFEPLYLCNIRCNYCYIGERLNILSPSVPPLEITFDIIRAVSQAGVHELYLAGGEPTAHPHFDRICHFIAEAGFGEQGLVTNGTLLNPRNVGLLKDLDFWVNVSIRGPNEMLVDSITRTRGVFRRSLAGLRLLRDAGIAPGIEYDPIPANYSFLYETICLLRQEGIPISEVWLHRIAPFGDAASGEPLTLTIEQYHSVFEQAQRLESEFGLRVTFEDSFPLCLVDGEFHGHTVPCDCGITLGNIDPIGNLRRCACHPKNLGSILETPLNVLWKNALENFRSLDWLNDKCRGCALLSKCGGGCAVSTPSQIGYGADRFVDHFQPLPMR